MQFFIPHAQSSDTESTYAAILDELKKQFRLPIQDRRIYNLNYTNSRKHLYAEVGLLEELEQRYVVIAIFESKQFMVYTRTPTGTAGPIILIDKAEVTDVEDFEPAKVAS